MNVSIKEVISRIVRNTGYKLPSQYLVDLLEWIPEALGKLQCNQTLIRKSTPSINLQNAIVTSEHVAKLPCGIVEILAVEDENGYRVPEGSDSTDITNQSSRYHNDTDNSISEARTTNFQLNPALHNSLAGDELETDPAPSVPFRGEDIVSSTNNTANSYYLIQGNYIQTSLASMFIKIHYLSIPVDSEGYPMIPDNEDLKSALYWYVMSMLIGAGYEHKVFNHQYCQQQFEFYSGRALGTLRFPTEDKMAKLNRAIIQRLIPPYGYYSDFGIGYEGTQQIYK